MSTAPKIAKLDMATSLTECPEFSALQSHYEASSKFHMRALFEGDPGRFEKFRYRTRLQYRAVILQFFCFVQIGLQYSFVLFDPVELAIIILYVTKLLKV